MPSLAQNDHPQVGPFGIEYAVGRQYTDYGFAFAVTLTNRSPWPAEISRVVFEYDLDVNQPDIVLSKVITERTGGFWLKAVNGGQIGPGRQGVFVAGQPHAPRIESLLESLPSERFHVDIFAGDLIIASIPGPAICRTLSVKPATAGNETDRQAQD